MFLMLLGMSTISVAHAQNDTEKRSYLNCYESAARDVLMQNLISPEEYAIDLTDLEIKKYISNFCNFIYEKSGKWLNLEDWRSENSFESFGFNGEEFVSRYYPNGFPESLQKMWETQRSR